MIKFLLESLFDIYHIYFFLRRSESCQQMLGHIRDPASCLESDLSNMEDFDPPDWTEMSTNWFVIRPYEDETQCLQRIGM
jgi:hypothetical protein